MKKFYKSLMRTRYKPILRYTPLGILGTWLLKRYNRKVIARDFKHKTKAVHICPHCLSEVGQSTILGQNSFSCMQCYRWGPWKDRISLNPNVKKQNYTKQFRKIGIKK